MALLNKKYKVGLNAAALVLIGLVLLIMANYLAHRHYQRFDWTKTKLFTLSDKTKKIIENLQERVHITVFFQPVHVVYKDVKTLLSSYESASEKIKIEYVDPDKDLARIKLLAQKYKIDALNTIVFECGKKKKYITDNELVEMEYPQNPYRGGSPQLKAFKGEEVFTSAILAVTQEEQKTVYFVSGHGEKDIEDAAKPGMAYAATLLNRDNYLTKKIVLVGASKIPEDCAVLIIAGPLKEFTAEETSLLEQYLKSGGKIFIAVDPLHKSGLEELLLKWGIKLEDNIVVDPEKQLPFVSAANLYVDTYSGHPVAKNMKSVATLYFLARSLDTADNLAKEGLTVSFLAQTSASGWGEVDTEQEKFSFDETKDKKGPVSIAAAVEGKETKDARLIVFGDADFISNGQVSNLGNSDMFLNSINWLAVKEKLISISSKPKENASLRLSSSQISGIFWWSMVKLPCLGIFLGVLVWWKRRK